jgi:glycogen(starch) synthase
MKICIYTKSFYPFIGGIENFVFLLARELEKFKYKVTVVTDVKTETKEKFPFKIVRNKSFLKKINIFKKHDIILCTSFSFKVVPAALLSGKKIFIVHQTAYHKNGISFFTREYLLSYIKTRMCFFFKNIAVSKFVSKSLPGDSKVIYNMYNNYIIKKIKIKKKRDFVFCGRLIHEKGVDLLIDAFFKILKKNKKSYLTIIGNGPEYNKLKKKASELGINNNVEFTGSLTGRSLNKKLNEHYCMVVPSQYNEPFGIVALEGLATTQFVISSNRGGLPDAIGNCGKLIEPNLKNLFLAMNSFLKYGKFNSEKKIKEHIRKCKLKLLDHECSNVAKKYINYFTTTNNYFEKY